LNDPETADAFVSYLKREQYGSTPLLSGLTYDNDAARYGADPFRETSLPRRWSTDPGHVQEYARYASDLDYFLRYQVGHMYVRYFLWQFVGKRGDYQNANWTSGLAGDPDPGRFRSPSERASRNVYFGLPLILGLVGM